MSVTQAANALSQAAPYSLGWRGLAGYQHNSGADQTISSLNGASRHQAAPVASAGDSSQVSLSDAARALAAFDGSNGSGTGNGTSGNGAGATGSSDFDQEASLLGGLTDASLVAMGIITPDQESGTQISFNSLSYNVSSSTSASIQQQNGQTIASYGQEQQAELVGEGQITTADGRTFQFQVELDLDQSQQVSASGDAAGGLQNGLNSAALATGGNATVPGGSDSSSSAAAAGAGGSSDTINWNEILKQSKTLFDLLAAIGQQNPATLSNSGTASSAAGSAGTAAGSGAAGSAVTPASSTADKATLAGATQAA